MSSVIKGFSEMYTDHASDKCLTIRRRAFTYSQVALQLVFVLVFLLLAWSIQPAAAAATDKNVMLGSVAKVSVQSEVAAEINDIADTDVSDKTSADEASLHVVGTAIDINSREPIYTEWHYCRKPSGRCAVRYRDMEDRVLMDKLLDTSRSFAAPEYVQVDYRDYRGQASVVSNGQVEFYE